MAKIGIPDHDQEARDAIAFGFLTNWFLTEVREAGREGRRKKG